MASYAVHKNEGICKRESHIASLFSSTIASLHYILDLVSI
jgi:hypothetical protein